MLLDSVGIVLLLHPQGLYALQLQKVRAVNK